VKLQNPEEFTGHCFRRTSTTFLADAGANLSNIKRHGGWKSTSVAEGYIENSIQNKINIAKKNTEPGREYYYVRKRETRSPRRSDSCNY
jgi:integrase